MSWWEPLMSMADGAGEGNACGIDEWGTSVVGIGSKYGVVSNLRLQLGVKILPRTFPAQQFGIYDINFPNKHWLHSKSVKSGVHCTWANIVWKLGPVLFAWAYIRWESPAAALFPRILRRSPTTSFYWSTFVSFWL